MNEHMKEILESVDKITDAVNKALDILSANSETVQALFEEVSLDQAEPYFSTNLGNFNALIPADPMAGTATLEDFAQQIAADIMARKQESPNGKYEIKSVAFDLPMDADIDQLMERVYEIINSEEKPAAKEEEIDERFDFNTFFEK